MNFVQRLRRAAFPGMRGGRSEPEIPNVPEATASSEFCWVDDFIANVRPFIFVRTEDNILIKRPNQAQKLNATGAAVLKSLLDGDSIQRVLDRVHHHPQKTADIARFLRTIRLHLEDRLDHGFDNPAVDIRPFDMKFSEYPVLSEMAVTYRCNLTCAFCYAGSGCTANPTGDAYEMTAEEIRRVLDGIFRQARVPSVSFTGGEPTLRPELPGLVRYAKDLGMRVNLITNGTLISRNMARILAQNGLDSAQVSLEGITARTHDGVTGRPGAFEKSIAAVNYLKQAGIHTHTNTTISQANLEECAGFPKFVKERLGNDRFSMNLMIPTGSGAVNDRLMVRYQDVGAHLEEIIAAADREGVEFMWYSPVPMCMFNSIVHDLGNKGCSACDGLLSVGANGDVLPCASYDDPVGNLLKQDFKRIWRSVKARRYRDKSLAHPACKACEDFAICNGACPLYWRQAGFDELEEVWGGAHERAVSIG